MVRWVDNFAVRHGEPAWSHPPGPACSFTLTAPDGAVAVLQRWPDAAYRKGTGGPGPVPRDRDQLRSWAEPPERLGLVLLRRGGYAVGLAEGDRLVRHHCGTRYVQSRTAAGGWSQQRFARRRRNQADALAESVVTRVGQMVLTELPEALVVGGDRALVRQVVEDARLAGLAGLPRRELYDLPDPRLVVLDQALRRGRAVRIRITESD